MAQVLGLDHISIIVSDAEASLNFYQDLLGLECLERPDLGFPGYWLNLHKGQTIHIMQLDNPFSGVVRPKHGGRDFHFALRVDDLDKFVQKLTNKKRDFTLSQSGRKALFARDLDNNTFELFQS